MTYRNPNVPFEYLLMYPHLYSLLFTCLEPFQIKMCSVFQMLCLLLIIQFAAILARLFVLELVILNWIIIDLYCESVQLSHLVTRKSLTYIKDHELNH